MRVTTLAARVLYAVATIAAAVTIAFVSIRVLPGTALRAQQVESGIALTEGLDTAADLSRPISEQFMAYVTALLRGDLGASVYSGRPVTVLISERLPSTVTLALTSILVTAILVGLAATASCSPRLRPMVSAIGVIGSATPTFIGGTIIIGLLGVPSPASIENAIAASAVLSFYVASTLVIPLTASIAYTERHMFVVTARAKGLTRYRVFWIHVMPNAIRPLLGLIAGQIGFLMTGTVVTEALFARGGVGRLMLDSVMRRDYPVVQGLVLYAAVVYVLGQMLAGLAARGEDTSDAAA